MKDKDKDFKNKKNKSEELAPLSNFMKDKGAEHYKILNKKLDQIYAGESALSRIQKHRTTNRTLFGIRTKEQLKQQVQNNIDNPGGLAALSKLLHSLDSNYAKIISYYAHMYNIRYTVVPVKTDHKSQVDGDAYLEMYNQMMEVVDGLSLETLIPSLLEEVFLSGSAYVTSEKNNAAKTASLIILPPEFSRIVLKTNLGTNVIEFNFKYFDAFRSDEQKKEVLELFPKEFTTLYSEYLKNTQLEWKMLDPRHSTAFTMNDKQIPPFINALDGILEYETVRGNEIEKSDNELKSIFIHRIPVEDGEPIFDINEVVAIQQKIAQIVGNHKGLDSITTFGESEIHRLQDEGKMENKRIEQSFKTIYNSAGINANIFNGTIDKALEINLSTDKALVWSVIQNINSFVNLTLNNLFKFKAYQTEVNLLPITIYKEKEEVKAYMEAATFGVGKLDAVVALGIKQKHLLDRKKLEDEIKLDELLVPLKSSHTTTTGGVNVEKTGAAKKDESDTGVDENERE